MTAKGDAHESLSLLIHRDGVPPTMIFDGSKEQTLSNFKRKSETQTAMVDRPNHTPRGNMPPRDVSMN